MTGRPYFAYGSNLSRRQMVQRCPRAVAGKVAELPGWRFLINSRGVATLVPDAMTRTMGLVWQLTSACEASLDRYEGVTAGHYRKETLMISVAPALVYFAADARPGTPRPGYLERILEGAAELGLPDEYLGELASWRSTAAQASN